MPADVLNGLNDYVATQLDLTIYEGEIPRYDPDGNQIVPSSFPVFRVAMQESGLEREWTFENVYDDTGDIFFEIYGTSKPTVLAQLVSMEGLLVKVSNWSSIDLGGAQFNVYKLLLTRWYLGQEANIRLRDGSLLFRGELHFAIGIHGAVDTE